MNRQWLEMRYNRDIDSWVVMEDGQITLMLSGEWFDLYITEEKSYPCQLEFSKKWLIKMGSLCFQLRPQDTYKIEY